MVLAEADLFYGGEIMRISPHANTILLNEENFKTAKELMEDDCDLRIGWMNSRIFKDLVCKNIRTEYLETYSDRSP